MQQNEIDATSWGYARRLYESGDIKNVEVSTTKRSTANSRLFIPRLIPLRWANPQKEHL